MAQKTIHITFVCYGNICRSPLAAGIFECMLKQACPHLEPYIVVYSAGTSGHNRGSLADDRSIKVAEQLEEQHGLVGLNELMARHRAKEISTELLLKSDYLCVMDEENWNEVHAQIRKAGASRDGIFYFGNFSRAVPGSSKERELVDHYASDHKNIRRNAWLETVNCSPPVIIHDPWYGTMSDFEQVAQISLDSSRGLLYLLSLDLTCHICPMG